MNTKTLSVSRRAGSSRNFYGQPTVQMAIYPPVELRERIQREVVIRTVRDGAGVWNESRVIVDLLYEALAMVKPGAAQNGHGNDRA
ncbi:MAG: hypothetical protein H0W41_05485 [Chloroflexi bacterium]|nr:hypothetical protein [Chloroflexota bacterium]